MTPFAKDILFNCFWVVVYSVIQGGWQCTTINTYGNSLSQASFTLIELTLQMAHPAPQDKAAAFHGALVNHINSSVLVANMFFGDQLGLFRGMKDAGRPVNSQDLANLTGTDERYVREWLINQAANQVVDYDSKEGTFILPEHIAQVLLSTDQMFGAIQTFIGLMKKIDVITNNIRTGGGIAWGDNDPHLLEGVPRFFNPVYESCLIQQWIPALDGVQQKLENVGSVVLDVGCGNGFSTALLAKAFPNSRVVGFDYHEGSINAAKQQAAKLGNTPHPNRTLEQ